jgi:hypothetical protein
MINKIFISFLIYAYFFCGLGNTCFRMNANGIKQFNILPLFTEGLIGPIRSLFLLVTYGNVSGAIMYLFWISTSLSNIFGASLFVFYISKLVQNNF